MYWYYECLEHTPPIRSGDEFTQHTDDCHYRHGVELAMSRPVPESDDWPDEYFDRSAHRFLTAHPTCMLQLVSEYGVIEPLPGLMPTDPRLANEIAGIVIDAFRPLWVPLTVRYGIADAVLRAGFTKPDPPAHTEEP